MCAPILFAPPVSIPAYAYCVGGNALVGCASNVIEELVKNEASDYLNDYLSETVSGAFGGLAKGLIECKGIKDPICLIENTFTGAIKNYSSEAVKDKPTNGQED